MKPLLCFACEEPALPGQIFCVAHLHMQPAPKVDHGYTHYAVIDEHGEIVTSVKVEQFRDAEKMAAAQLRGMSVGREEAQEWSVKGVTVHE